MPYKDRDKKNEYQRVWIRKNREEFLFGRVCAQCGSTERLEVDHIDPKTKVEHRIWSWSPDRREAELRKCQILCRVCHIDKSRIDTRQLRRAAG